MKKAGLIFLVSLFLVGCLSSCGKSTRSSDALPQTIRVTAELPKNYPAQAKVYRVDWMTWTEEGAAELFFPGEEYERVETAMGPQLLLHRGQETEYLNVFSDIVHQMAYTLSLDQSKFFATVHRMLHILDFEFGSDNLINQEFGAGDMAAYGTSDLSFGTLQDAKQLVEEKLAALGLSAVELRRAESRDQTTMKQNREILLDCAEEIREISSDLGKADDVRALEEQDISAEDEHYYLSYRQMLDGIPFADRFWPSSHTTEEDTFPTITAYVDRDGLESLKLNSPIQVGEVENTVDIMSPEDALDVYLSEYKSAIHFDTTEVSEMELAYIVELDSEKMIARPAGLISLITDKEVDQPLRLDRNLIYTTLAVSADTGTILESNLDLR